MKFTSFEPIDLKNNFSGFEVIELVLSQIVPDENQARKDFDESSLEELSASIKQYGIIQPVIVRKYDDKYKLVAGERRWRAAKRAGLNKIPAIIREYDKHERLSVALIENIQRKNLNVLEEAQAIQNLLEECAMTHNQVAESLGKSRTSVTNLLRLLELHIEVKIALQNRLLEMGHARALLALDLEEQKEVAQQIINKKLSVREAEKLIQKIKYPQANSDGEYFDPAIKQKTKYWIDVLTNRLSAKVKIHLNNKGEGKVIIPVSSADEIDWLVQLITSGK